MAKPPQSTPRVQAHVERLREAGLDTQKFFDALVQIRDDKQLPSKHREALYKLIAMESMIWYLEAIRNERIDRMALRDAAIEIVEQHRKELEAEGPAAEPPPKRRSKKKPGRR